MIERVSLDRLADVNRWIGCDFSECLANELNVLLACGEGGAVFAWRGPGIYEVHVFFEQRGREVLTLSHAMLAKMREEYGARLFWAMVPDASRKVKMFTRLMGWKSLGPINPPHGPCELFVSENFSCLL